ncbi:hypothetical protein EF903_01580 [Streptomyces sp. WAC05292]|uniref:thermonuclease family protein n=1 Tax=Streptomyces sp. WAC05292 TaxID=2487418 RepID=UPI000F74809B|nr:thermonuclease family protein [Streptomyces sp. WAC05292]RSS97240.1 hypothetical protein EF903_01580 [Streptomyces sp. WAC05292]
MTFTYSATVMRTIDGDTLDLDVDLGFGIHLIQRVRLHGINTAEKSTAAGKEAAAWAQGWIDTNGPDFTVETHSKEKYGRYLATLTPARGQSLNAALIEAGHAVAYDGHGPRPVPPTIKETP